MAKGKKRKGFIEDVEVFWHEAGKRKNAVPVGLASYDTSKPSPRSMSMTCTLIRSLSGWGRKSILLLKG